MKPSILKHCAGKSYNSPLKQTDPPNKYKEDTKNFKGFNQASDTLVKGNSRDLSTAMRISEFNGKKAALKLNGKDGGNVYGAESKEEKLFKESDGSYTSMRIYNKDRLKNSVR